MLFNPRKTKALVRQRRTRHETGYSGSGTSSVNLSCNYKHHHMTKRVLVLILFFPMTLTVDAFMAQMLLVITFGP